MFFYSFKSPIPACLLTVYQVLCLGNETCVRTFGFSWVGMGVVTKWGTFGGKPLGVKVGWCDKALPIEEVKGQPGKVKL